MTKDPFVSIICLCYNHEQFVTDALNSAFNQSYPYIEVIVIDDASTDNSVAKIRSIIDGKEVTFIQNETNLGNCKAFNIGLAKAKGKYIIDLATDDILMPDRVEEGVLNMENNENVAINFSNAEIIDTQNHLIRYHYPIEKDGYTSKDVPEGDVYQKIVSTYFICPPTMMMRKRVLDELGGYDENLSYEDFDLLVRASRNYPFSFTNKVLVKRRLLKNSLSKKQYKHGSEQMRATFMICEKILKLNKNEAENKALKKRIIFEMRQCVRTYNWRLFRKYFKLLRRI